MCSNTAVLDRLVEVVDELAAVDLSGVPAGLVGAELVELRRQLERVEAQWLRRVAAFDAAGGAAADGASSTGAWLRGRCRIHPGLARDQVLVARQLAGSLQVTASALDAGGIGVRHAMVIAAACRELPAELIGQAEAVLVEAAERLDPAGLSRVAVHLRYVLDPDGALAAADRGYDRRRLSISSTFDGLVVLDGLFDPEGGETLLAALDPLARPAGSGDRRSPAQRRADALVELARQALDTGRLPTVARARPHLNVITTAAALQAEPGAAPATLSWTGPVPPDTVRRIGCDATLTPITVDPAGQPLDVGRTTRIVPPALRAALTLRDRGCVYPGCDRPPPWTDAHHLTHWADGGPTRLDNLALLCRWHHRYLHEHRQALIRGPDGTWTARRAARGP